MFTGMLLTFIEGWCLYALIKYFKSFQIFDAVKHHSLLLLSRLAITKWKVKIPYDNYVLIDLLLRTFDGISITRISRIAARKTHYEWSSDFRYQLMSENHHLLTIVYLATCLWL